MYGQGKDEEVTHSRTDGGSDMYFSGAAILEIYKRVMFRDDCEEGKIETMARNESLSNGRPTWIVCGFDIFCLRVRDFFLEWKEWSHM